MDIKVKNASLIPSLFILSRIVEARSVAPALSMILLRPEENGGFSLTAGDTEVEIQHFLPDIHCVGEAEPVLFPAHKLASACRACPADVDVSMSFKEKTVAVVMGAQRYQLNTLPAKDFPLIPEKNTSESAIEIEQREIKFLIDKVAFSMAHNDIRYFLNGMLFEVGPEGITAVATDGHRLGICRTKVDGAADHPEQKNIVSRKAVSAMQKVIEDDEKKAKISADKTIFCVDAGEFVLKTKVIEGQFPDYRRALPSSFSGTAYINAHELRQKLNAVSVVLEGRRETSAKLEFKEQQLILTSTNPEGEQAEADQAVSYEGPEFSVALNIQYLQDVLSVIDSENVIFEYNGPTAGVQLREDGSDAAKHIIMPVSL